MALWNEKSDSLDWNLVRHGFVTKYFAPAVLTRDSAALADLGYRVITLDASTWADEQSMHLDLAASLDFPNPFGRNLDALHEGMHDVASLGFGWEPTDTGLVLAIERFDAFATELPHPAFALLDTVWDAAAYGALLGNRMLCLVGTSDPEWELPKLGSRHVPWNPAESRPTARHARAR